MRPWARRERFALQAGARSNMISQAILADDMSVGMSQASRPNKSHCKIACKIVVGFVLLWGGPKEF
eukprot:2962650-Pyramimonas_sp.AAC.1